MLKGAEGDRYEIASAMSRLTGKDVSKLMLDGWSSEARDNFNMPFYLVPAFECATSSYDLTAWLAAKRGARVYVGRDALVAGLDREVQTNEVGRSAALIGGYLTLARRGLPLRVLEVGASAGLNLRFDRFRFEAGQQAFGPADSPLRFVDPWVGAAPDLSGRIEVASRRGCDLDPIDPTTHEGRLRLRSYVWPDQPVRRARLDAALLVAEQLPVTVDRADAVTWLGPLLAAPIPGVLTVVVHSIVFQYLSPADRNAFLALLDDAGSRATDEAPLAWLRMEPGGDQGETRLTSWPTGTTDLLCRSAFHGPPVVWIGG